jgi:hypothetical protein
MDLQLPNPYATYIIYVAMFVLVVATRNTRLY